jgi:predicted transcriptional regulator
MPTTISLSDKLQHQLKDVAERTGKPQEEIVSEALTQYFSKSGRTFSSLGAGDDPTLDARQTKELLKEAWGKR